MRLSGIAMLLRDEFIAKAYLFMYVRTSERVYDVMLLQS